MTDMLCDDANIDTYDFFKFNLNKIYINNVIIVII